MTNRLDLDAPRSRYLKKVHGYCGQKETNSSSNIRNANWVSRPVPTRILQQSITSANRNQQPTAVVSSSIVTNTL